MELPSANNLSITNKRELVSMISTLSERDLKPVPGWYERP